MPDFLIAHIMAYERQGDTWGYHTYYTRGKTVLEVLDRVRAVVAEILEDKGEVTSIIVAKVYEDEYNTDKEKQEEKQEERGCELKKKFEQLTREVGRMELDIAMILKRLGKLEEKLGDIDLRELKLRVEWLEQDVKELKKKVEE